MGASSFHGGLLASPNFSPCQDPNGSAVHPYLEGTAALPVKTPEVLAAAVVPPRLAGLAIGCKPKKNKNILCGTNFAILKPSFLCFELRIAKHG